MQWRERGQLCLAMCDSREAQSLALLIPVERQVVEPLEMLGGEFGRLPACHDGLDNVGSEECEGEETADLVGGKTLLSGDVIDADVRAGRQFLEPGMGLGDGGDENGINRSVAMAIADDQPCLDTAPPQ